MFLRVQDEAILMCIYFRFFSHKYCIDIFLCTLLHLAEYFFNWFLEENIFIKQFTGLSNKGSSVIIGESRGEMDADALKNEVQKQVVEERQMVWKHLLQDDD